MNRREIDAALISQGVSLVPRPRGTTAVSAGFKWGEVRDAGRVASLEEASRWVDQDRAAITGINDLVVFDWDSTEHRARFWDRKILESLAQHTLVVKSRRGYQEWFFDSQAKDAVRSLLGYLPDKVDARPALEMEIFVNGHLASVPGNLHWSRECTYELQGTVQILRKDGVVAQALKRLKDFGWSPAKARRSDKASILQAVKNGVDQGQRNDIAFAYAKYLLTEIPIDVDTVLFELERWNQRNRPPLPIEELRRTLESAVQWVYQNRVRPADEERALHDKRMRDFLGGKRA